MSVAPSVLKKRFANFNATRLSMFILVALSFSVSLLSYAHAKSEKVKVWRLVQRNQYGKVIMLVADNGIKITYEDQHVSWVCTAPTWVVSIVNSKENLGQTKDLVFYSLRSDADIDGGKIQSTVVSQEPFMGHMARKVSMQLDSTSDSVKEKVEMVYQTATKRTNTYSRAEFVYADFIKLDPHIKKFFIGYYRLPGADGLMLEESHVYAAGRKHVTVSTDAITEVRVDKSEFAYPTGYKKSTLHAIMQENQKAKQFSSVIQDLFLDDPAPKKKSNK